MTPTPSFPQEDFLAKWLAGELSDAEREAWKSQAEETDLEKIVHTVADWEVPAGMSKEAAWARLNDRLAVQSEFVPHRLLTLRSRTIWISVAAAAILLVGLSFFFRADSPTVYTTGIGEKMTVVLPDDSEVTLNALSELSFAKNTFAENRTLSLRGEAFFVVEKGQRFTVETERGEISVLGTRFNVQSRPEQWEVRCYEGKVQVASAAQTRPLILTAGEMTRLEDQTLAERIFQAEEQTNWTTDYSAFDDSPLVEVIAELERQYAIQVILPPELSPEERYTGGFPHKNLTNALELVFGTWNYLPILEDDGRVRLSYVQ